MIIVSVKVTLVRFRSRATAAPKAVTDTSARSLLRSRRVVAVAVAVAVAVEVEVEVEVAARTTGARKTHQMQLPHPSRRVSQNLDIHVKVSGCGHVSKASHGGQLAYVLMRRPINVSECGRLAKGSKRKKSFT